MKTSKGTVTEVSESQLKERIKGDENRSSPRVPANLSVDLPLVNWEQAKRVYSSNISKGGLLFVVPSPATMAATVRLNITLPDGQTVSFDSEVRHVSRKGETAEYEVGVQFRLDADNERALDAAIKKLQKS
jgi:c-di-GMP-binding flagellar brake protein YcgR